MRQFDYDKIVQKGVGIYCKTEKQAKRLLKWADSVGLSWADGDSFNEGINNMWKVYGKNTVYSLTYGYFFSLYLIGKDTVTILRYKDVLLKKKKKK